jgi:hypothetical protein
MNFPKTNNLGQFYFYFNRGGLVNGRIDKRTHYTDRIIMNYVYVYVYTLIESPISWYIPKTFPKHLSPRKHTTAKSDGLSPAEKLR